MARPRSRHPHPRTPARSLTRPRLLFYVQHLLGIGHLVRGARIAAALARDRFEVTVALGGPRPAGVSFGAADVVQLPPVVAGPAGFSALVAPDGTPFDAAAKARRRHLLLGLWARLAPDVLLLEAFPFGRRAMRFELLPLLEAAAAARPRPLIATSVRDIVQENRGEARVAETVALVREAIDLVVVHGDPRLSTLADSFPAADRIADRIANSGLVGPDGAEPPVSPAEHHDVVVSVGGGAVGAELLEAALAARALGPLPAAPWLVVAGPNLPESAMPAAPAGVTVRRFAPDLPARLRRARLSVSQAGYNTVADLLAAPGCRAVLVPYAAAGETEQSRRAALMERAGRAVVLPPEHLGAPALADAMGAALALPTGAVDIRLDGAARTGELLDEHLTRVRHGLA